MDLSIPIASIIPSLDGPVLVALAGTSSPLTLSDVHRLAGRGSLSGVRRVLRRMVDVGLVDERAGGYVLNRDHLAAPAIEDLATLHSALAVRIRNTLESWEAGIVLAGVFGPAARRDGDADSDIDVLVISDRPGLDDLGDDLAAKIRVWTGNEAHVVAISTAVLRRLQRDDQAVLAGWRRDLVPIMGDKKVLETP